MLIEFSVGNYLSFKDKVTFSMVASKVTAKYKELDENNIIQVDDELSLLKSAAVYGANASGKSNLVKALNFMQWFVLNSSRETQITDLINVENFKLSTETAEQPSCFEIVFLEDHKIYRYGFEVNQKRVLSEWLFYVPKVKEFRLFERKEDRVKIARRFKEGDDIISKTRNNALFLSVVAQFNGEISKNILLFFARKLNVISGLHGNIYRNYTIEYFKTNSSDIINLIKKLDLGIDDISIKTRKVLPEDLLEIPEEFRTLLISKKLQADDIYTTHKKYNAEGEVISLEQFDLDKNESEGTKKLFAFAGPILETLRKGEVIVIDELDARLHPLITRTIIDLFNSNETNINNAQLIFMTHDTNLLSDKIFRRDQIWFTEKDRQGATDLYSLVEYKIENDASFESDYIKGRYGAIPFIGDLSQVIKAENDES
ncbi:MAG: AAA family ATPase [Limnoraphis robusta]|jgi:AAA15 family ATPase/GTPase